MLYRINGIMNASNEDPNAPARFMNNPKYGIDAAIIPLVNTIRLLKIIFFKYGYLFIGQLIF